MGLSRLSFRWKAILGIALIEAMALSVTITGALGQMEHAQERQIRQSASTALDLFSAAVSDALLASDLAKIEAVATDLVGRGGARLVRVFDIDNRLVVERGDTENLAREFDADNTPLCEDGVFDASDDVRAGTMVIGRVEIGVDNTLARDELAAARKTAAMAAVGGMTLAALFSWLIGGWLAKGIAALAGTAERIADGELGSRAPERGEPEVVSLAHSFNRMSEALAKRDQDRNLLLVKAEEAAEQARRADRAKSTFLAAMSHEIRTPLNGVIGLARILAGESARPGKDDLASQLVESAAQLRRVVDDVLDFSKVEAGGLQLEAAPFDPLHILRVCLAGHRVPASDKGVGVDLIVADASPVPAALVGDATRLAQIVNNFLSNAVKFTERGNIRVRATSRPDEADAQRCHLHIAVEDSGPGIDLDSGVDLFEPFRQADASINRSHGGTGLGLTICRRLAQAMGGEVGCGNGPDGGAVFWLDIPFELGDASSLAPVAADGGSRLDGFRLLVADDNRVNRTVAEHVLRRVGAQVDAVSNGAEAVTAVLRGNYDAVLMDLQMPEVDGKTATRRILAALGDEAPPIMALTANALAEERAECLALGMVDYLTKPFDVDVVVCVIRAHLPERSSAGPALAAAPKPDPLPAQTAAELDLAAAVTNCAGDETMFREVLEMSLPELVAQFESSHLRLDSETEGARQALYKELHGLKGAVQNLGLMRIGAAIGDIEQSVRNPSVVLEAINPPLEAIAARMNAGIGELRDYLSVTA